MKTKILSFRLVFITVNLCLILALSLQGYSQSTSQNYKEKSSVFDEAGGRANSTNFKTKSTVGQPSAIGKSQSSNFKNYGGFFSFAYSPGGFGVIQITLNRTSIPFGSVLVGQSKDESLTITNSSSSSGNLTGSVSENSNQYSIVNGAGSFDLAPGQSHTVQVRFSPTSAGSHNANLIISHNSTNQSSPINVPMSGSGVQQTEIVTNPTTLSGPFTGKKEQRLTFETSGASSSLGHSVEYQFEWGDGDYSDWGSGTQSHKYSRTGSLEIRSRARCQTHTDVVSSWSGKRAISISLCTLNIAVLPSEEAGTVTKQPDKNGYDYDEIVNLEVKPASNWHFDRWEGDLEGSSKSKNLRMTGDKNVAAIFDRSVDLEITDLTANQVMYNTTLVANKTTIFQIYVKSDKVAVSDVKAKLWLDGSPYTVHKPYPFTARPRYSAGDIKKALDTIIFWFDDIGSGPHSVRAELIVPEGFSDPDLSNNIFSANFSFAETRPIQFLRGLTDDRGGTSTGTVGDVDQYEAVKAHTFAKIVYPVANGQFQPIGNIESYPFMGDRFKEEDLIDHVKYLENVWLTHNANNPSNYADYIVDFVPQGFLELSWLTNATGAFADGWQPRYPTRTHVCLVEADDRTEVTFAHESGHIYGLEHWDTLLGIPPIKVGPGGFDPIDLVPIDKNRYDLMNSTSHLLSDTWISNRTFDELIVRFLQSQKLAKRNNTQRIGIIGTITSSGEIELDPMISFTGNIPQTSNTPNGNFVVRFVDSSNLIISEFRDNVFFTDPNNPNLQYEEAIFSYILDFPSNSKEISFYFNGVELFTKTVSVNPPDVKLLTPNGGETIQDNFVVTWQGTDSDGDELTYDLLATIDNNIWFPVCTNIKGSTYNWNLDGFPGGTNARLKVVATDGVNSGEDISDGAFSLQNFNIPEAFLLSPTKGSTIVIGTDIVFHGSGYDAEDGELSGNSLIWRSSVDGDLGEGEIVAVSTLSEGTHTIILTAYDTDFMSGTDAITIQVAADSDKDGMPDVWENQYTGLEPNRDDSREDLDKDDLINVDEYDYKTDPTDPDTDGDGYTDGFEAINGSDPTDLTDIPTSVILSLFTVIEQTPHLLIKWETSDEVGHAGFNLYRTSSQAQKPVNEDMLNKKFIIDNSPYTYLDKNVVAGQLYFYWLEEVGTNGQKSHFGPISGSIGFPGTFALEQNYPNPFNDETIIHYQLPANTQVSVKIFNLLGQEVRKLIDSPKKAGYHKVVWDGKDNSGRVVSSGIYFYKMETKKFVKSRKLLLVK